LDSSPPIGRERLNQKRDATTLGYCEGTQNLIHTDPEYARGFGFRAPIIAGNQTVNFLLEGPAMDGLPRSFDILVRLLRRVFWDDAIRVLGRRGGEEGRLTFGPKIISFWKRVRSRIEILLLVPSFARSPKGHG
jgi:hypothetical protein